MRTYAPPRAVPQPERRYRRCAWRRPYTDVVVKSVIKQPAGHRSRYDYSMEKLASGWMCYDVKIEGISLVETIATTFNSQIQRSGVDG